MQPPFPHPVVQKMQRALAEIAAGRPVIVVDDADGEDEGDLVFAAALATPTLLAFTVRHTSGFVCAALTDEDCDRLDLPPMHQHDGDRFRTAYRVTVDLQGTGTGISAANRARTIAALADPDAVAADFRRPGHVVPLRAREGGVLARPGHTEAAVDLARLAGLPAVGGLCEIVSRDKPGEMAGGPELFRFATDHDLVLLSIAEIVEHRRWTESQLERVATTSAPTEHGTFRVVEYRSRHDAADHVALVLGAVDGRDVPVHVHTGCVTGDVLRSAACGCRAAFDAALRAISTAGCGVIVHRRPTGFTPVCAGSAGHRPGDDADVDWVLAELGVTGAVDAARVAPTAVRSTLVTAGNRETG